LEGVTKTDGVDESIGGDLFPLSHSVSLPDTLEKETERADESIDRSIIIFLRTRILTEHPDRVRVLVART
jgi:hypothetical protein